MKHYITSKFFIICLMLLLINDFYLKNYFHNYLTGKISDFAGLFIFPIFIYTLFGRYKKLIYILTAVLFIVWKSPLSNLFINYWNVFIPFKIGRIIDYSDFIALVILPLSYYYHSKKPFIQLNKYRHTIFRYLLIVTTCFSFIATAGTHGSIKNYPFLNSKKEVNEAIKQLYKFHPEYKIPDSLKMLTIEYRGSVNIELKKITSDSVSFHMFIPQSKKGNVFWCKFSEAADSWYKKECELSFIGISDNKNFRFYKNQLTQEEQNQLTKILEENIIFKIDSLLQFKGRL